MIRATKEGDEKYPSIRISDGNKSFLIHGGPPDPYWIPDYDKINDNDDLKFIINEDDGDVYTLFELLYKNIISGNTYPLDKSAFEGKKAPEIKKLKAEKAEARKRARELAQKTGLVDNGIIRWISEDLDPLETAAVLTIEKRESQIEIVFSKSKKHPEFPQNYPTYAIRISISWSIYREFSAPFVRLHRNLQVLDLERTDFNELNKLQEEKKQI